MKLARLSPVLVFVLFSCATSQPGVTPQQAARATEDNLTRAFAELRAAQVEHVSYDLSFILRKGATTYDGLTRIRLALRRVDQPLSIDFVGGPIHSIEINGAPVADYRTQAGSLEIPAKYLARETTVALSYTSPFNPSPTGFYRSVDSTDQREYLYTDFEPYQAHLLFPCLDQPDLKATFDVSVTAPKSWKVISNALESEPIISGEIARTEFHFGKPISTYLFFLGAGDYHEWKDHYGKLPLRLYSRESISKFVDAPAMFDVTKRGLAFYESYFAMKYPFPKLGHVFIPDFIWGGMENPGAITLNERNVFRGKPSGPQISDRMSLVLHEMAHMWFGDLVTLKWWNDTWLNEAFATYVSSLAEADGLKQPSTWNRFYSGKTWGYFEDSLVTTHPIEAPIPDTLNARENFDGITYAKGASALQQLRYFVGPAAFKKGVRHYFHKHAWGNTVRADFIDAIAFASGKNLDTWTHAWLQTAGPNRVMPKVSCANGRIESFSLEQEPNASGTLSPHRTQIGFYYKDEHGGYRLGGSQAVSYSEKLTPVPGLIGKACPSFVNPNEADEDYALFSLDPASLETARASLSRLPGSLVRITTWGALNQMVQDGKLSPKSYFDIALSELESETVESVLAILLDRRSSLKTNFFTFLTPEQRTDFAPRFESIVLAKMSSAKPGSSLALLSRDFYFLIARSKESRPVLLGLLSDKRGAELDQDRRWAALTALSASGAPEAPAMIASESQKDTSSRGKALAYAARIAAPNVSIKDLAWADLLSPTKLDESTFRAARGWFTDPNHPELMKPYSRRFFEAVASLDWDNQVYRDRIRPYFDSLFPDLCTAEILSESQTALASSKANDAVRKAWLQANDRLSRCVRARALR